VADRPAAGVHLVSGGGGGDALTFPFGRETPEPGRLREVAPGVHWLRMPLPLALNHVNLWVLDEADGGVTLVDTGMPTEETKAIWDAVFAGPLGGRRVHRVLATHGHPDHVGLAGWLCPRFDVDLWMTLDDWAYASALCHFDGPDYTANQVRFYTRAGLDAAGLEGVRKRGNTFADKVLPLPQAVRRLAQSDSLDIGGRAWRVLIGEGHSLAHACLYCPALDVMITGDQILPRITPNISVWPQEPEADPLRLFTTSLTRLRPEVTAQTLALPSHGLPFRGVPARIDDLLAHHEARLAAALAGLDRPSTALDMMPLLFDRPLDDHQVFFAIGESLAHLHALRGQGHLVSHTDAAGVTRFHRR
jgi:glyoxylase-like metal-dependent hydrolase (beta-lactamase superfamily II)